MTGGGRFDGAGGVGLEGSLGGMAGGPLVLGGPLSGDFRPDTALFSRYFQLMIRPWWKDMKTQRREECQIVKAPVGSA